MTANSGRAQHPAFCLFGAAPDTPNLGVTALHDSIVAGLLQRVPGCDLTVFDFARNGPAVVDGKATRVRRLGAQPTRRIWRPEALWNMRLANRLGGAWNVGTRRLRSADAVLDASAGDSFSDIYGFRRFNAIVAPKRMALEARVPLILMPQTYGPFKSPSCRAEAVRLVAGSALAWARDPQSFERLRELLGDRFDAHRHRLGVDVAFGLPVLRPSTPISRRVDEWLVDGRGPVVGLNVSGLIYLDPERARSAFDVRDDYPALLRSVVDGLLERDGTRVVLIPHALSPIGHSESDRDACKRLSEDLGGGASERLEVLSGDYRVSEIKELLGRLDWFCGTRMHSTIGALSSGTPAAALAYSPKFRGVFEQCAMGHRVVSLSEVDRATGADLVLRAFDERLADQAALDAALERIRIQLDAQFDAIAKFATTGR